jgi:hypothetical protein
MLQKQDALVAYARDLVQSDESRQAKRRDVEALLPGMTLAQKIEVLARCIPMMSDEALRRWLGTLPCDDRLAGESPE